MLRPSHDEGRSISCCSPSTDSFCPSHDGEDDTVWFSRNVSAYKSKLICRTSFSTSDSPLLTSKDNRAIVSNGIAKFILLIWISLQEPIHLHLQERKTFIWRQHFASPFHILLSDRFLKRQEWTSHSIESISNTCIVKLNKCRRAIILRLSSVNRTSDPNSRECTHSPPRLARSTGLCVVMSIFTFSVLAVSTNACAYVTCHSGCKWISGSSRTSMSSSETISILDKETDNSKCFHPHRSIAGLNRIFYFLVSIDYQARRRWRENSVKRIIEHRQYFLHFFLRDYRPSQIVIYIRPKIFHSIKHRLDKFISVFRPP